MIKHYTQPAISTLDDLEATLDANVSVLLVEGTRKVALGDEALMREVGALLARRFPRVVFRTGNAEGSDTAFAQGIARVDATRIEYVVPTESMGRKRREGSARAIARSSLPTAAESRIADETTRSTPGVERLVNASRGLIQNKRLAAKGNYLLRDTLKVVGAPEVGLAPATAGLFYVNEENPLSGGTGHTIRVCNRHRVPVVLQHAWRHWV